MEDSTDSIISMPIGRCENKLNSESNESPNPTGTRWRGLPARTTAVHRRRKERIARAAPRRPSHARAQGAVARAARRQRAPARASTRPASGPAAAPASSPGASGHRRSVGKRKRRRKTEVLGAAAHGQAAAPAVSSGEPPCGPPPPFRERERGGEK